MISWIGESSPPLVPVVSPAASTAATRVDRAGNPLNFSVIVPSLLMSSPGPDTHVERARPRGRAKSVSTHDTAASSRRPGLLAAPWTPAGPGWSGRTPSERGERGRLVVVDVHARAEAH